MPPLDLVIGCPVWERGWCLDIWFDSVLANSDPANTGLVFVVPATDHHTRDVITRRSRPFAWCEVIRDRNEQYDRIDRRTDQHRSLALARNIILRHVQQVQPRFFLSWDSDLLVGTGLVPRLMRSPPNVGLATVWCWLNRAEPRRHRHFHRDRVLPVEYQEAMQATVMEWDGECVASHLPADRWHEYTSGWWRCDVALAFQLMRPAAYSAAIYTPHPHGEDIPFNWALEQRGVERWCYGVRPGLHLFDKERAQQEIKEGYPKIMKLARQLPLAATRPLPEDEELAAIGFWPLTA